MSFVLFFLLSLSVNQYKIMKNSMIILLLFSAFIFACSKKENPSEISFPVQDKYAPLLPLSDDWVLKEELMKGFPTGIQVYGTNKPYKGNANTAFCVVFDPKLIDFKPTLTKVDKKVSAFYDDEEGDVYAAINAGFFGPNVSYSLVKHNNEVFAVNIKSLSRPYQGGNSTYYPTRGAFGLSTLGGPQISWVYSVGSGTADLYSYPSPSPNFLGSAPQPVPSANFPEGGKHWNMVSAVGGSPILIKDGKINITDEEELIAIDNGSNRARSAIGYSKEGIAVLLAVEGGGGEKGAGMSLPNLATFMEDMGCYAALNLDGGGSSYMVVNGKQTITASGTTERSVTSAIILKKK